MTAQFSRICTVWDNNPMSVGVRVEVSAIWAYSESNCIHNFNSKPPWTDSRSYFNPTVSLACKISVGTVTEQ